MCVICVICGYSLFLPRASGNLADLWREIGFFVGFLLGRAATLSTDTYYPQKVLRDLKPMLRSHCILHCFQLC